MLPATTKQWTLEGNHGFDSLQFDPSAPIPQLGERKVLVRFHFASLNYRDVIILKVNSSLLTFPNCPSLQQPDGGMHG